MAVPAGLQGLDPAGFLDDLEARVARLEAPQGFLPAFLTLSTNLSTASAAQFGAGWAIATNLKTVVWSDGAHWYRADTGALIV